MRSRIALLLGIVMVVLGVALIVSTFVLGRPQVTSARALDGAFAAFFLLRGAMNIVRSRRRAGLPVHPRSTQP